VVRWYPERPLATDSQITVQWAIAEALSVDLAQTVPFLIRAFPDAQMPQE
jgi:hypothetical protein